MSSSCLHLEGRQVCISFLRFAPIRLSSWGPVLFLVSHLALFFSNHPTNQPTNQPSFLTTPACSFTHTYIPLFSLCSCIRFLHSTSIESVSNGGAQANTDVESTPIRGDANERAGKQTTGEKKGDPRVLGLPRHRVCTTYANQGLLT